MTTKTNPDPTRPKTCPHCGKPVPTFLDNIRGVPAHVCIDRFGLRWTNGRMES